MHASLNPRDQLAAFLPSKSGFRKIIIASNIAETSITLPSIGFVIDSGLTRQKILDPSTGVEILITIPISQASAKQRAGRTGRENPGKAYRLYTKESYEKLQKFDIPEIKRSNLMYFILTCKMIGIKDFGSIKMLSVNHFYIYFLLSIRSQARII